MLNCKHQEGVWLQYKNLREISVELQAEIEPDAGWIWQSKSLLDRKHCVGILQLSAGLLADHASSGVLNCKHGGQMATAVIMQAGRDNGGLQRDVDRRSQSTWCFALHCIEWDQMQAGGEETTEA